MVTPKTTPIMRFVRGLAGLQSEDDGSSHFRLERWSFMRRIDESGSGAMQS